MEKVVSIRGAITVKENSVSDIKEATIQLLNNIFKENALEEGNLINIIFTVTDDIDAINPATITREDLKIKSTPLICMQEMKVRNGLTKCIRVMLQAYSNILKENIKHIYLGEAANLRPDLSDV